jgi:YD repeat-containing protein
MTPIVFHSEILEDLRSRAEISRANEDVTAARLAFGEYSREEDGGGVYINETAAVPLPRSRISLVQYDTACNRFVLHAGDKRFWTPPMDPERTAVAIQCLDDRETEPKQLAMSFDIHPVTMKRVISGIYGYQSVLFNCPHLEDTELGSILIDADKLLESIWMGKNREGDNLTKKHHYHSLAQMALDHPAIAAIIQKKPAAQIDMGMRWWIRPAPVKMHLSGDTLAFGDISFRMFTETVRFQDPRWFKGEFVPNPGADAFCRYFNDHYPSFEDFVGRIDDHTGREIRPFKELKEVVKIVAFLRWVIGASGETGITMDTSWAYRYGVKKVRTPGDVISIALHNVESEIQPPIQIYNQYGLSRVIDRNGRTTWFKYDGNGQLKSITSDR